MRLLRIGSFLTTTLALLSLGAALLPACGPGEKRLCPIGEYAADCSWLCPAPSACDQLTCKDNLCSEHCVGSRSPAGTPCNGEPGVCDGNGACVTCVDDTQCGEGLFCDGKGKCVACREDAHCGPGGACAENTCVYCDDKIQNGDETAVDCGGRCGKCLGSHCETDNACASGICVIGGVCCETECAGCNWCPTGKCEFLPMGYNPPDMNCGFLRFCNGSGGCGWGPGHACMTKDDCATLNCVNGKCELPEEP